MKFFFSHVYALGPSHASSTNLVPSQWVYACRHAPFIVSPAVTVQGQLARVTGLTCFFPHAPSKGQFGGTALRRNKQNEEYSRVQDANHNILIMPSTVPKAGKQAQCICGDPRLLCLCLPSSLRGPTLRQRTDEMLFGIMDWMLVWFYFLPSHILVLTFQLRLSHFLLREPFTVKHRSILLQLFCENVLIFLKNSM